MAVLALPVQRRQHATPTKIVLVLAGSFNPITDKHLELIRAATAYFARHADRYVVVGIVVSPVHKKYKKPGLTGSNFRLDMCTEAVREFNRKTGLSVVVSDWEVTRKEYSTTIEVLTHFQEEANRREARNCQGSQGIQARSSSAASTCSSR